MYQNAGSTLGIVRLSPRTYKSLSDFEPRNPQIVEDQSRVLPSTTKDHVDGVSVGALA